MWRKTIVWDVWSSICLIHAKHGGYSFNLFPSQTVFNCLNREFLEKSTFHLWTILKNFVPSNPRPIKVYHFEGKWMEDEKVLIQTSLCHFTKHEKLHEPNSPAYWGKVLKFIIFILFGIFILFKICKDFCMFKLDK